MLTGKYRKGEAGRAEGFGGKVFQPENSAQRTQVLDTVIDIAKELSVTPGQVAIAWAGTHGAVPIVGPRSPAQLADNLGALSLTLSAQQLDRLDSVSSPVVPASTRIVIPWAKGVAPRVVA
jgi:aryl-alcohol dehydrogenase-like predicted oxidoreductase